MAPNNNRELQSFKDIFSTKKTVKPPAYQWQDLALRIITELHIPSAKRNAVFRVCKLNTKAFIEHCLNETKELAKTGEAWRYFFKLVAKPATNKKTADAAAESESKDSFQKSSPN